MQQGTSRVTTDSNQRPAESAAAKPKLLDQVRQAIRARHYSKRTERTYVDWINLNTTMIYTHVLNKGGRGVRSPADML